MAEPILSARSLSHTYSIYMSPELALEKRMTIINFHKSLGAGEIGNLL